MARLSAWLTVAAMLAASVVALLAPLPILVVGASAAWFLLRRGRWGFLAFAAFTLLLNAAILAWLHPSPKTIALGPVALGPVGAVAGVTAGLRITMLLGLNLAALSWLPPARLLDGLGLPRRWQAFLAAILIAAQDVGRDAQRLVEARRLQGAWPRRRATQVRAAAMLLPMLFVAAQDRARRRREALRLAGLDTGRLFAPIVAVTALAAAGRLALVALPNISLTFVIVFAGGVAFGARVGFWAGFWSMLLTDLVLSGLYLPPLANVPTMALLGAAGGLFQEARGPGWSQAASAATIGIVGTLAWSVATDALTWLMVAESRASVDRLRFDVAAGLAFNAVPSLVNGALFAAAIAPIRHAIQASPDGRMTA